jgi:hypothetical protein
MTPNQRRALNKGLAALEAMAVAWAAEVNLSHIAQVISDAPAAHRPRKIKQMLEQAFIEGAYRHYLDRDPMAREAQK